MFFTLWSAGWSALWASISWSDCISKSEKILCVIFSRKDFDLYFIPFGLMVKFQFLAHFPGDHRSHSVASCLIRLFSQFAVAVVSILLYGCTTRTLTKRLEMKLDGNYTRMLRAILNKSWRQHPTRHQLYDHLPPITKTIQARHCWRNKDELISDVLLWTPAHGQAKAGWPPPTYIQQLCEDTGCSPEDLPEAMNDREKWRQRVRDIRASGTIWWWSSSSF